MTGPHPPASRAAVGDYPYPHPRLADSRSPQPQRNPSHGDTSGAGTAQQRPSRGGLGPGRSPLDGADPLARTLGRLLRPLRHQGTDVQAPSVLAADAAAQALALRLDERGCASGRVTAARLDEVSRAFDRLEAKLNAILVAVTATFVSTLLGLLAYALRVRPGVLGA